MKIQLKMLIKPLEDLNIKSVWVKPSTLQDRRFLKEAFGYNFIKISASRATNVFLPLIEAIFKMYSYFLGTEDNELLEKDYIELADALILSHTIKKWSDKGTPEEKRISTLLTLEMYKEKVRILSKKEYPEKKSI